MNGLTDERLHAGARLFNAGHWWEAHEAWEGVWMVSRGQERDLVQGLILLAAALHKRWRHGSLTHRNFDKARKYLDPLPGDFGGVPLRELTAAVWTALQDGGEGLRPQLPLP